MKNEKIKNIAKKIAEFELLLQTSEDKEKIKQAENGIMELSTQITSIEEMCLIDDMVQKILDKVKIFWYNIYIRLKKT